MPDLPPPRRDDPHPAAPTTVVPPPPAQDAGASFVYRMPRVGDLTTGWRVVTIATWMAVFFAMAGVWKASEEIGIRTWWLGPRSTPQPVFVQVLPFVLALAITLAATYNARHLPWISVAGGAALAVSGAVDLSRSVGLGVTELIVAGAALLAAVASLGGRYRRGRPLSEPPTPR